MADEEKNETTEETPDEQAPEAPPEDAPPAEDAPKEQEAQPEDERLAEDRAEAQRPRRKRRDRIRPQAKPRTWPTATRPRPRKIPRRVLTGRPASALQKSRESGEAGPQRTPEERAAERDQAQAAAAKARSSYRKKQRTKSEAGTGTEPVTHESAGRKERQGYVVSDKADKTITVRIDVARRHRTYEKIVRTSNTLHAHDESNEAGEGDLVKIVETRPLSKTKRWRLVEVMEKAK